MDLDALINTVKAAVTPVGTPHRVLLTKVDTRSLREAIEAQNSLLQLGILVCNAFICIYKVQERAILDGVPIAQW